MLWMMKVKLSQFNSTLLIGVLGGLVSDTPILGLDWLGESYGVGPLEGGGPLGAPKACWEGACRSVARGAC